MTLAEIQKKRDDLVKQSVVKELVDAQSIVRDCLSEDEKCRNDDRWLMLRVWQKQGIMIMIDFERWKDMFAPETIRRVRQDIQSTADGRPGEFLPTDPDVLVLRKVKEEAIRNFYSTNSWVFKNFQKKKYGVDNK